MELSPVTFSKGLLDAASEDERMFHVMAGQLANDLNILTKLMAMAMAMDPVGKHVVLIRANSTLVVLMIRLIAGRLNEGWELIRRSFLPLHKKYESDLTPEAMRCLEELKKYFRKENLINKMRKKIAFHADGNTVREGYRAFSHDDTFVDYHSPFHGNCLYYSAEKIGGSAMLQLAGSRDDPQKAVNQIVDEINLISKLFGDFILDFMKVFMVRYVAHAIAEIDQITIADGPPLDTVTIPFFCTPPDRSA
jgi:hypothetical protein